MSDKNWSGFIIFGIILVAGIIWGGSAIYSHYHNAPPMVLSKSPSVSVPDTSGSSTTVTPPSNGLDANGCYTPATVRNYENMNGCVDFNVGYTYTDSAGTVFIDQLMNYTAGVEVYIPYNSAAASINLSQLQGKNIKATGYIQNYYGAPQVTVTELSQIGIYN